MCMTSEILYYSFLASFDNRSLVHSGISVSHQSSNDRIFFWLFFRNHVIFIIFFALTSGSQTRRIASLFLLESSLHCIDVGFFSDSSGTNPTGCNHLPLEWIRFLFILAVIAHHLPEGIAVGVGFEVKHHMGMLLVLLSPFIICQKEWLLPCRSFLLGDPH